MNREPLNNKSLLTSIIALVIGILLCFSGSEIVFDLIGYIISGILIISGITKIIIYNKAKAKGMPSFAALTSGVLLLIFGGLCALYPSAIPFFISIIIGVIILFNGINRLILGVAIRKIDGSGSRIFTLVSMFMILLGILIITQTFFNLLGVFIIIYAVSEIFGYVYYKSQNKDYSEVFNKEIPKSVKDKEAKDADYEED